VGMGYEIGVLIWKIGFKREDNVGIVWDYVSHSKSGRIEFHTRIQDEIFTTENSTIFIIQVYIIYSMQGQITRPKNKSVPPHTVDMGLNYMKRQ